MSTAAAIPVFLVSALVMFAASGYFADKLDHVGPQLGLPEAVVGLLTAVAADTPEIASAIAALAEGDKQASLGVVIGSNVFNLAAMVGLSAVLAGAVVVARRTLMIEGAVSVLTLLVAALLIGGALPAWLAFLLFLAILAPYLAIVLRRDPPAGSHHTQPRDHEDDDRLWKPVALIVPAVALIVVGAIGMVRAALALAGHWGISETVTGVLILAVITSLPNAFTAVRLGLAGRGDALVTETLASNTINLIGGILIPALFVGLASATGKVHFDLAWLGGMTAFVLVALAAPRGLGRAAGVVLIAFYVTFLAVHLAV
jgi:cation:H+ antiporter